MNRRFAGFAMALLVCAGGRAATVNTTLSVTASASAGASGFTATGTASLSGIGSGTFAGTLSLTSFSGPYTITLSGGAGTITGTLTASASILSGNGTGSATVTGGTGTYAGATGSFPTLLGTGSITTTGAINLTFSGAGTITTGGGGPVGPPAPTITSVQDAAGNTPSIAQGSIFIVKGTNLSASGFTSYAPPRPTAPSGVKVTFTPAAGGTGTDAYIVYLFNQNGVNQIAAILPSTVAPGSYNVTVTSGSVSAPVAATVVANKVALFTQDSTGTGLASVQNYISQSVVDLNRLTTGSVSGITISPAHPGQPVIAYGTGLGANAAGDNDGTKAFIDFRSSLTIQAIVGGMTIPVDYAGRAGFPGEDQINFTLPANVPTGCAVSLQISVNGKLSPATSISIAPDTAATACVLPGYTADQLKSLDGGGSITAGGFAITQFGITLPQFGAVKSSSIGGTFFQLNAFQLSTASQANVSVITVGSCQLSQVTSSGTTAGGGSVTYLDAGTVTVTGPSGSSLTNQVLTKTNNSYGIATTEGFTIPGQLIFTLPPGAYTINGAGGPDVGAFNATLNLATPLTVTGGLPTTVPRSSPLTLNWTGGNASDLVEIIGGGATTTGTGSSATTTSTTFICITTAGQKTFTVPTTILSQLPASTATSPGTLEVASGNTNTTFTAPLPKIGGSVTGFLSSFVGTGAQVTWQ